MARHDVYPMPAKGGTGYLIDVQANLLSHLATRTVVPLVRRIESPSPVRGLNPVFDIAGVAHVMLTQAIVSVPAHELRQPATSLTDRHDDIMRALDILLTGL